MNKHYSDARYYVGRAVAHIRAGLTEDLQPVADRAKERLEIDEPESESSRVQQFRTKVQDCLVLPPSDGYLRRSHGRIPSS